MARFRAIEKGYYGDVMHDPVTEHHVFFDAPDDFKCSWAVPVDGAEPEAVAEKEVSEDTVAAEQLLDTESAVATPDIEENDDANKAAGVETL